MLEYPFCGARIVIASRSPDHHARGLAAIGAAGGEATAVALDVRRPDAVAAAFDEAERSEERRVGKECEVPCRSRWSPYH